MVGTIIFYGAVFVYFAGISFHLWMFISGIGVGAEDEATPFWKDIVCAVLWPAFYAFTFGKELSRVMFG